VALPLGTSELARCALRRAMAQLATIYHPDKGGQSDLMGRVNDAYERAQSHRSR
jgi:hypothetical protein